MSDYTLGFGRFTPGVSDADLVPRVRQQARPLVVFMGGGSDTAAAGFPGTRAIVEAVTRAGFPIVVASVPLLFGSSTAQSRVADAITWGRANRRCTSGAPVIMGKSNGAICGLAYARANPVACVVTFLAPVDLNYVRDNNISGFRASIDAAWGVTYPAALPAHADPWTDRADWTGKNLQQWAVTDDVFDNPSQTMAQFAAAASADFHSLGALGHTDAAVQAVDPSVVVAHLLACTA